MAAADTDFVSRPQSVKELSALAQEFDWNSHIPLRVWLRTAYALRQEAAIYLNERNFAKAYMIYMRYSILLMEHLLSHPEAKKPEGRRELKEAQKGLDDVLKNLEKIKPIINRDYDAWQATLARRRELQNKQQEDRANSKTPYEKHASKDPSLSARSRILDASDNQELAVQLAQKEMRRRDAEKRATRKAGVSPEEEQHRRTAGFWDNWTDELADQQAEDDEMFRRQMESTRRRLDSGADENAERHVPSLSRSERDQSSYSVTPPIRTSSSTPYHYPSIARSEPVQYESKPAKLRKTPPSQHPPRPPKETLREQYHESAPSLPDYLEELISPHPASEPPQHRPDRPPKVPETPPSLPTPPPKSQRLTFRPAAYLENGEPIRSVFLPGGMRERFLSIAADNTRRGLEMCGILCGTAVNNALFVRCLLIPEQKCSTDTCEMENENSLLDYCISEDLLMLGWIHTHPTQTCFMSSRDLHTQAGYQVMLPESIAIVCAPRFEPSYGIFRLTNPPGLSHILHCTQQATFHQHSIENLYTGAEQPAGHVFESDSLDFFVHDLRPGAKN